MTDCALERYAIWWNQIGALILCFVAQYFQKVVSTLLDCALVFQMGGEAEAGVLITAAIGGMVHLVGEIHIHVEV
jgi:hypothetical protein